MPPQSRSTAGSPAIASIGNERNAAPSGTGRNPAVAVVPGWMSRAGFARVRGGAADADAPQSSAKLRGRAALAVTAAAVAVAGVDAAASGAVTAAARAAAAGAAAAGAAVRPVGGAGRFARSILSRTVSAAMSVLGPIAASREAVASAGTSGFAVILSWSRPR